MAYRFHVNQRTCINCGICMDLCPVRCLDMTRPAGEGEMANEQELLSPIPREQARRGWMMLAPVQVAACLDCQVCAQECPANAITIEGSTQEVAYARRGPLSYLPPSGGCHLMLILARPPRNQGRRPGFGRHAGRSPANYLAGSAGAAPGPALYS